METKCFLITFTFLFFTQSIRIEGAGGPARVTFTPTDVSLSFNEKGIIPCFIDSSPAIQFVSWTKNGRKIEIFEGSEIYTVNNGSLLIEKVRQSDAGNYTCAPYNIHGSMGKSEIMKVVVKEGSEYPARVTYTPLLINMTLDQKGILPCYFDANPPVQYVSWTKDRRLFDPFDEDGIQVLTNGSVLIKKVTKADSGNYTCTPYNKHGNNGTSDVMSVVVQGREASASTCVTESYPPPRVSFQLFQTPASYKNWDYRAILLLNGSLEDSIGEFECLINDDVSSKTSIRTINTFVDTSYTFHAEFDIITDNTRQYVLRYRDDGHDWINLPITTQALNHWSNNGTMKIYNLRRNKNCEFQVFSEQKVEATQTEDNRVMMSSAGRIWGGITVSVILVETFIISLVSLY